MINIAIFLEVAIFCYYFVRKQVQNYADISTRLKNEGLVYSVLQLALYVIFFQLNFFKQLTSNL